MKLKAGAALGPYRIVEELGRGGMGAVYKAYQPSLDRFVAVKVLPAFFAEDAGRRARFKREATTIAQLDHPAILPVYEYGEKGLRPYIVMALAEGGTVASQVREPLSVEAAVKLLGPVAEALDHAHQRGILHRDVKPANVLLRRDGRPLLSDFGLARSVDTDTKLTDSGIAIGTPDYMAPELRRGEPAGPESDQYSLAVMCHELMTGLLPLPTSTVTGKRVSGASRLPHLGQAPQATRAALARALANSPKDRFATCSEFIQALSPSPSSLRSSTPTDPASVRMPRSALIAGTAVLLVLVIVAATLAVLRVKPPGVANSATSPGGSQTVSVVLDGLKSPSAFTLGSDGSLYVVDTGDNLVKKVVPSGKVTVVAKDLHSPSGVAVDDAGNVYISDTGANQVLVVGPRGGRQVYAGNGRAGNSGDRGLAASAELSAPTDLVFQPGPDHALWILDQGNNRFRQVLSDGIILGPSLVTTKDEAFDPKLDSSGGIAFAPYGNGAWLYLSSASANQLFARTPGGIPIPKTCTANYCMAAVAGVSTDATSAPLNHPHGIAVTASSDIYIADTGNDRIRLVDHLGSMTTVVGGGTDPKATKPLEIQLKAPEAVVVASNGTIFIADTGNHRILKVTP
jgi:serine/threonine protein kinase